MLTFRVCCEVAVEGLGLGYVALFDHWNKSSLLQEGSTHTPVRKGLLDITGKNREKKKQSVN